MSMLPGGHIPEMRAEDCRLPLRLDRRLELPDRSIHALAQLRRSSRRSVRPVRRASRRSVRPIRRS